VEIEGTSGGSRLPETQTDEIISGLNDLLQLDHDAVGAYEVAMDHLENRSWASQIEAFKRDHERHIRDLNDLILRLGGTPSNESHVSAPLKEGIQRISAAGGDRALLVAWRTNELYSLNKHESYQKKLAWPADTRRVLDRNTLDEERHFQWAVRTLGESETGEGTVRRRQELRAEAPGVAAARERAARIATAARERAARGMGQVAGTLDRITSAQAASEGLLGRATQGAQQLARGLETAARKLAAGGDGPGVRGIVEREISTNPARSLFATFAIGFLIGRSLR
jgi:rubrerythrin